MTLKTQENQFVTAQRQANCERAKFNSNAKFSRKSQTTIFMIMGLLILIGGAIFFYSTKKIQKIEPEIKIVQEQIPVEFEPIRNYVTDCAYSTAVEGLKIIGKQGGYVSFTDKSLSSEPFTITQNPTESDAVYFSKDSNLKTAYWWYLKSANNCRNDCKFASKRPELRGTDNSIEKQLERYISQNIKSCINGFKPFAEQGFRITEGALNTNVNVASDDVAVLVDYPLEAERHGTKSRMSQFFVRIPVSLEKIYDLATKITNLEIKHRYLEKHSLNLIVAFSGVDKNRLPPMSDMQFKFGSTTSWQKSDVKSKVAGLLQSYVPLFQADGTYNYKRNEFDSELAQRLYDSTIIPVANSSYRNLAAYFDYLDFWPMYFSLNCNGERCVPSSANSLLSFFGIQDYRFVYDISFPVLVEVQEPFALNGKGYTFDFFLEANVRNNKQMPADFTPLERADVPERTLLCDARTSGNVSVQVLDAAAKKPLGDAQVLYTIIDESCFIGSTDENGILRERFPVGAGGVANIVKDGYIGKAVEFEPRLGRDDSLKAKLQPIYTKKLIVKKKNVVKTKDGWQFSNIASDLDSKESATVALTRISDGSELDFSSIGSYQGQQSPDEIEIAPGNYAADISLVLNDRIIIPERQKCVKKGIFGSKECITIPKIDFGERASAGQERFPEGGLRLNFTISPGSLEKSGTIVLYAVSINLAGVPEQDRTIEDAEQMGKIEDYSATYQTALQPSFQ